MPDWYNSYPKTHHLSWVMYIQQWVCTIMSLKDDSWGFFQNSGRLIHQALQKSHLKLECTPEPTVLDTQIKKKGWLSTLTMFRILAGYSQKWAIETFRVSYFSTCSLIVIVSLDNLLRNKSFSPFLSSVAYSMWVSGSVALNNILYLDWTKGSESPKEVCSWIFLLFQRETKFPTQLIFSVVLRNIIWVNYKGLASKMNM